MLEHNDECPEKLMQMFDFFSAKTEDMFCYIVLSLKKARLRNTLLRYKWCHGLWSKWYYQDNTTDQIVYQI